ncbi:uncharacterized protein LOC131230891 isoform X2 [Magnolia sinica]|uniref:uncharacterized protein LOC131230891 isoform X2 n=1 Tax=Magnolia sinica TaxID=86752 RepID=UPI0026595DE2|nr:uncharacterized protein LOC131230891 isoform X2 [Magnolia sinica]
MGSPNIKDLFTSFSPSLDFLAITSGDGRIKIWDTLKGQVQTEFADITSTDDTNLSSKSESGHLSLDYTCMKWVHFGHKKKRKPAHSLLVLGTGSGDVLALDVAAGQLRWRVNDCHPGGVNAISSSNKGSCIYTAGADGMVCQIDLSAGSLLGKFRASTKAVSSLSISSDGKILATAAAQLKIFDCPDNKKIQKFSGHPVAVRCMIFTEDGKYILSSALGERYIAMWKIDGVKKQSASCVLSMDHPAVFLDSKGTESGETDDESLNVLAISELGVCYFWHGKNIEELRNSKPTKISLSPEASLPKNHKGSVPTIFAANLQGIVKPASGQVFVAYGSIVKPSFEKLLVQRGIDVNLNSSHDGVLLPKDWSSSKSQKGHVLQNEVIALDRANAEDAVLPIPKLHDVHVKKRKHNKMQTTVDHEEVMADVVVSRKSEVGPLSIEDDREKVEEDPATICMEDRLRSLGILAKEEDLGKENYLEIHRLVEANMPTKKIRAVVLSMSPSDAYKSLKVLVAAWRSGSGKYVLPWICSILVNHSRHVISQEPSVHMLDTLCEMTKSKCAAIQPLLQLSGRLQLIMAQVDKAGQNTGPALSNGHQVDESDDEDEDEDVDEVVYGQEEEEEEEDKSPSDSDVDN